MATTRPATPRRWVSFDDSDGDHWLFDLTFLTSNWTCIFGNGCQGVTNDPVTGSLQGCCSHGVHLLDDADQANVVAAAARLTDDEWENRALVTTDDDLFERNDEGELLTAVKDGACIFLNGPDSPTGPGCALHYGADRAGVPFHTWKPVACWQLPVRLETFEDSSGLITNVIRAWGRPDWGDAGADFDWWCTEDDDAFVGHEPAYVTLRNELIELVGAEPYQWLSDFVTGGETPVALGKKPS